VSSASEIILSSVQMTQELCDVGENLVHRHALLIRVDILHTRLIQDNFPVDADRVYKSSLKSCFCVMCLGSVHCDRKL